MLLSIIVPIYNSDKFLSTCINSLIQQDINDRDYEIILVNDGSTDNSIKIINHYFRKYSNIIPVHQNNKGNGAARNAGITIAKGKYLYFIDSDDYIVKNTLGKLLNVLEKKDLELLGFNSTLTNNSNLDISIKFNEKIREFDLKPINGIKFIENQNYRAEVWWYIVKKSFFNDCKIKFYDKKFVQDSYITTTLLLKANKIIHIPINIHRYRIHENSITSNKSPEHIKKHIYDLLFAIEKLSSLLLNIQNEKCLKRLESRQQGYLFFLLMRVPKSNLSLKELKNIIYKAKKLNIYPIDKFIGEDYNNYKYKVLTTILNNKYLMVIFLYALKIKYKYFKI
ncbi:glycosyltransferase [Thalassobellus suaedae]|uniref:Glycosyltransferase n=1 Tax=Thalassobellus suaedae TaxID=3074124 RepID=A0ABY9XWA6_9FLAO|nr:glycosyltransferase [Flavobacteriaceae bacterium HL-DH14]